MRKIVDSGFDPAEMGNVCVEGPGCGGVAYYVKMRRPLFVFAELRNTSDKRMRLSSILVRNGNKETFFNSFDNWVGGQVREAYYDNLELEPGEVVLIPECVLLSAPDSDPASTDFEDQYELSSEQNQLIGMVSSSSVPDYFWFGPSVKVVGFGLDVSGEEYSVPIHAFDPAKCYVYYRAWMCGSCPHLYGYEDGIGWRYLGELVSTSKNGETVSEEILLPENISLIRIVETDFEVSCIKKVQHNGLNVLEGPIHLQRGSEFEVDLESRGGILVVTGWYKAVIESPRHYLDVRQKVSLRYAYESSRFA